jgi:signal transduction histidine kinase
LLRIEVENENDSPQPVEFRPKSIAERAAALGGKLQVKRGLSGGTVVHIEIPI